MAKQNIKKVRAAFEEWARNFDDVSIVFVREQTLDEGVKAAVYDLFIDNYYDGAVEEMQDYIDHVQDCEYSEVGFALSMPAKVSIVAGGATAIFRLSII